MKNYADIYSSSNDSVALEQRFYVKPEVTRGVMVAPAGTDTFFNLPGGQITFEQPFESSTQRSGRHHNNIIKKKKATSWNFSTYFNIDEEAVQGVTEIDPAVRTLWKSLLGKEDTAAGLVYDASIAPDITFTLFEVGDKWARQSPGAFVLAGNVQLPGDGEATVEWSGNAKTSFMVGMGKSVIANDGGNTVGLQAGEADNFVPGAMVMIVKKDGTTRSTDTPDGSGRKIVSVNRTTDVVTLDGAPLADADGSTDEIYLVYYEPTAPTAIDNPVTGLVGSLSVVGLSSQCFRSLGVNIQNNHELKDYCYGEDGLGGTLFVPGDRLTSEVTLSMNLNAEVVKFFNRRTYFESENLTAVLGNALGRHFKLELPRVIFQVPSFSVPDTGSVPVEFTGTAYQTVLDAADEITASYL